MAAKPRFDGEWVRLGELTSCISKKNKDGRCATVCSVTNSQGFVLSTEFFTKEVFSKELRTYKLVERNQLAYNPSRINVGSIALQDIADEVVVSPLYIVFAVDASRIDSSYLLRYLKSRPGLKQVEFNSIGTVRNNLKYDGLCQISVPLPSLEVQRSRVRSLIALETEIKEGEETLSKLDVLVKSRFAEMFGNANDIEEKWALEALIDCVNSIESGRSPKCQAVARKGTEPGVLKLSALSSGVFLPGENKAMCVGEKIESSKEVVRGDILVARKNTPELVGACAIVREEVTNLMFPDIVFRMHPKEDVNGDYLSALLSSPSYSAKVKSLAHGSNRSMSNIPKSELAGIPIPVPPLHLQQEFAAFVARVDKSRFVVRS